VGEPPPRYSEASLVKKLEELGIGRPSTYASIISVLQNRSYVRLESKRFVPEDRGRLVNAFLVSFFDRYVQPGFTADLENKLDSVASGDLAWKAVLREFWDPFRVRVDEVKERRVAEVIDALNEAMARKLFPERADGGDPRICPLCGTGNLSLKLGRFGAFVGCSNYPECRYTRKLDEDADEAARSTDRLLGVDRANDEEVWLKSGRFGPYVQRGSGAEAKRCSLPPGTAPEVIDLDTALQLLALPREVGIDPDSGKPVTAGINRYGPFVQLDGRFKRLDPDDDVLAVGMNRALALLAEPEKGRRQAQATGPLKEMGDHPRDGGSIRLYAGRFGPYVKHGAVNASLPKSLPPEELTLERAVELLDARAARGGAPAKAGRGRKAPAAKAAPAKRAKPEKSAKAVKGARPAPAAAKTRKPPTKRRKAPTSAGTGD
jgi:DNA topoisomerase-1